MAITALAVVVLPATAAAETYEVDTLADATHFEGCVYITGCSLRDAIERADENEGEDTIEFGVSGTIELGSEPLPQITDPVAIDATTVSGYEGKPLVAIDGANTLAEGSREGLFVSFGGGGSQIEGLAIGGFDIGVDLAGGVSSKLCASYVGVGLDGTTPFPNGVGVETGFHAPGNRIGAECFGQGGNLISGNESYGVVDFGNGSVIANNGIGVDAVGDPLGNGGPTSIGAGILVSQFAEEAFIGASVGEVDDPGNVIAYNEGAGVKVENAASEATIRRNSIFANSELGIEVVSGTSTPVPQLESVAAVGSELQIAWSFVGPPEAEIYFLDLYVNEGCDPSGSGEGQVFLGTVAIEADGEGGSTLLSSELELPPADAEIFSATMTGAAGGTTSQFSECFNEAPQAQIESTPANPSHTEAAAFTFSGFDPAGSVAGFECRLDAAGFTPCTSPQQYPSVGQGAHSFEVRAVDKAGKAGPPDSYNWAVELPPAAPFLATTSPASPANDNAPKVLGTAPAGTAVTLYLSAGCTGTPLPNVTAAELEAGTPVPVASDSVTEISATASDGELTSPCSNAISYREDSTAPIAAIEGNPANPTAATTAVFGFSASDPGGSGVAGFECKLDAASFSGCASPAEYSTLGNGPHNFEVRAIDNAGNVGPASAYGWTVDSALPTVTIDSLSKAVLAAGESAELRFHADRNGDFVLLADAGFCGSESGVILETGTYASSPAEAPIVVAAADLEEGANELLLCLTSDVEATGSAVASIEKDSAPPATAIDSAPANPSSSASATFTFSGSDPGGSGVAGFQCRLDAAGFEPCASPRSFASLADGIHRFEVRAVDKAGNVDPTPAAFDWTIATPAPAARTSVAPVNGESVAVAPESGKVLIKVPGSDKFVPIDEYKTIPVGSIIDATNGKVLLTTIDADGNEQSAIFFGGLFRVAQRDGSGLTTLRLLGGNFNTCGGVTRGRAIPSNPGHGSPCGCPEQGSASTSAARGGRRLWGSGHGNFKTEGNNGSATVRGTIWFTEDRCDGTFFKVKRGIVSIRDFGAGKTFSLPAGQSYLAKP